MRVLILGAAGMLGHKVWQQLRENFDCWGTVRQNRSYYQNVALLCDDRIIYDVDLCKCGRIGALLDEVSPHVIVNCVGIVKQLEQGKDPLISIEVNALLPHRLYRLCRRRSVQLIQLSTDCVFSGQRGNYVETDPLDAQDLYGRTKALGEVDGLGALTIRSSIIGRQLSGCTGLLEWFLSQAGGRVQGFRRAKFSGFTTLEMARIISRLIGSHHELNGIFHIASQPISKYELLSLIRETLDLNIQIDPDDEFVCDRSLNGKAFAARTGYSAPVWREMIEAVRNDPTPYEDWRRY